LSPSLSIASTCRVVIPYTPATFSRDKPHRAEQYDISLSFIANARLWTTPFIRVIRTDCFRRTERVEALIGMDVLIHCVFQFSGPDGTIQLQTPPATGEGAGVLY
jgi:hypothetical protein